MVKKLGREFFMKPSIDVSKNVLSKYLIRRLPSGKILAGKIVEVEAYIGPEDRASHAFVPFRLRKRGIQKITSRNRVEYLEGGHVYIYLVYGMYWQLNITTGPENYPECFLIRAIEVNRGIKTGKDPLSEARLASGPGKLCNFLKVDKSFYGENIATSKRLWLEDRGIKISKKNIAATPRIGIDYAGSYWARRKLRFFIKNNQAVSGPKLLSKK
ncbi:MAG: DNA-3-methyladenine glycosylase [Patescibacteria group bacterium]